MKKIEILGLDDFKGINVLPGFYINTISDHLQTSHQHIERPHKHDFFATMVFTHGTGMHTIDFKAYQVGPGSVFMMSPGQVHHWELSRDADGFIFFHTQEFYEMRFTDELLTDYAFFSQITPLDNIVIDDRLLADFEYHFKKMAKADFADAKAKRHFILSHINQVYLEIARCFPSGINLRTASAYTARFSAFSTLLESRFRMEKSPEHYARALHVTTRHLNRINRETVGKSTSEIILERVMLEARRKLIHSDGNHNEIASALGYDDYAYFSKLFKKKVGMTPSEFQKTHR